MKSHIHRHLAAVALCLAACGGDSFRAASPSPQAIEPLSEPPPSQLLLLHRCDEGLCARRPDAPSLPCLDGARRPSCPTAGVYWPEHINPAQLSLGPRGHERHAALARWSADGALEVLALHQRLGEGELGTLRRARSQGCDDEGCTPPEIAILGRSSQLSLPLDLSQTPGDERSHNLLRVRASEPEGALITGHIAGRGDLRRFAVRDAFLPVTPRLCGDALLAHLEPLTSELLWPSESDLPIVPWKSPTDDASDAALLSATGLPLDTPVDDRGMTPFVWLGQDSPGQSPAEQAQAARFRALRAALEEHLDGVSARYMGTVSVQVLIVGRTRCGEVIGVLTTAIET